MKRITSSGLVSQSISPDKLQVGTEIYYTGDMANICGFGKITEVVDMPGWGLHYNVELEDGRKMRMLHGISFHDEYNGTCSFRFVLQSAYEAWRAESLKEMAARWPAEIKKMADKS
jgi:hypothetical protein